MINGITCDNTCRIYGPRIYTRSIEESDWAYVKSIYGTYKDFLLTDAEAKELSNVWARNSRLCTWPLNDKTDMEHTGLFCLNSNDMPVGLFRTNYYKKTITFLLSIIDPIYQKQNYFTEGVSIIADCAWLYFDPEKIVTETRLDYANRKGLRDTLDPESMRLSPGYTPVEYKTTTLNKTLYEAYRASERYVHYPYTLYPVWPGEPV